MPLKVNIKTRLRFNGREYDSVEAMPPEARAAYERVLASAQGVPGQPLAAKRMTSKIIFNGHEVASPDDLPPELRAQYDKIIGQLDANHNGVPDVLEGGQLPAGAVLLSQTAAQPAAPAAVGDDAASAWMESLARKQNAHIPQTPDPRQSPASLPVVSEEPARSRRLILAAIALLVLLAGVAVFALLLWSQIGPR